MSNSLAEPAVRTVIDRLFTAAVPVSVLSVIAALFIRQVKLRTSNTTAAAPPAAAVATASTGSVATAGSAAFAAPAEDTGAVPPAPGGMH